MALAVVAMVIFGAQFFDFFGESPKNFTGDVSAKVVSSESVSSADVFLRLVNKLNRDVVGIKNYLGIEDSAQSGTGISSGGSGSIAQAKAQKYQCPFKVVRGEEYYTGTGLGKTRDEAEKEALETCNLKKGPSEAQIGQDVAEMANDCSKGKPLSNGQIVACSASHTFDGITSPCATATTQSILCHIGDFAQICTYRGGGSTGECVQDRNAPCTENFLNWNSIAKGSTAGFTYDCKAPPNVQ